MIRAILNIGGRFAIFIIAGAWTTPTSVTEALFAVIVYTLIIAEIDHATSHRGINIREYVKYAGWPVFWGVVISCTGLMAGYTMRGNAVERAQRTTDIEKLIIDAGDRSYRLFDQTGRLPERSIPSFELGTSEIHDLRTSSTAGRLLAMDDSVFNIISLRVAEWLDLHEHTPHAREQMQQLFSGFRGRVDIFVKQLPSVLDSMRLERQATQTTQERRAWIDSRATALAPTYDSVARALRVECRMLEYDMAEIAQILDDRIFWKKEYGRYTVLRNDDVTRYFSERSESARRSLRIMNTCRDMLLAYYHVLERPHVAVP